MKRTQLFIFFYTVFFLVGLSAQNCPTPTGLVPVGIKATSAGVFWQELPDAQTYKVEWKLTGTTNWTSANTVLNSYRILGLDLCTDYDVRVSANCDTLGLSDPSSQVSFTTNCIPDCEPPLGNYTTNITDSSALLNWTMADSMAFTLRFRRVGDTAWQVWLVNDLEFEVSDLYYCTSYEWQVATNCPWAAGEFGILRTFTSYCGQCVIPEGLVAYDESQSGAICIWRATAGSIGYDIEWREVGQANWQVPQFTPINGYTLDDLEPCKTYEFRTRSICATDTSDWSFPQTLNTLCSPVDCAPPVGIQVDSIDFDFINLSWDGDSAVAGFTVQFRPENTSNWTDLDVLPDGFVTIPDLNSCTDYQVRIRTNCQDGLSLYSDTIDVQTLCMVCDSVTGLVSSGVGYTEASFAWSAINTAVQYDFQYRPVGVMGWTNIQTMDNVLALPDLTPCTDYVARVRSICSGLNSGWTDLLGFTTTCCDSPMEIDVDIEQDAAQLSWTNTSNGLWSVFVYNDMDTLIWDVMYDTNFMALSNLMDCQNYTVSVASVCGQHTSGTLTTISFDSYCCPSLSDFSATDVLLSSATISWEANMSENWVLDVQNLSTGQNTTILTDSNSVFLNNLDMCSGYQAVLSGSCGIIDTLGFLTLCCPAPSAAVASISNGTVTINWDGDPTADTWQIQAEEQNTGTIIGPFTASTTSYTFEDLPACASYIVTITSLCSAINSPSTALAFATPCCTVPILSIDSVDYSSVDLSWTGDAGSSYTMFWENANGVESQTGIEMLFTTIEGLDSCTTYAFYVGDECDGFPSDNSDFVEIMTLCTSNSTALYSGDFSVYPNPARNQLSIEAPDRINQVQIIDQCARVVFQQNTYPAAKEAALHFDALQSGVYCLQIFTERGVYSQQLILIP